MVLPIQIDSVQPSQISLDWNEFYEAVYTADMTQQTYTLLDFGDDKRLEQWGTYRLIRPDPTAFGLKAHPELWDAANAEYHGEWIRHTEFPEQWITEFDDLKFITRLAPSKHTGVFPEQEQNWKWIRGQARQKRRPLTVLNLFAYTGGSTMALAKDGHSVTHVDSSKPTIAWAKENAALNQLGTDRVRWIVDDAAVFVGREVKRGKRYDGIILDPPAYGHSPSGKAWRVERDLAPLLEQCCTLLTDEPSFVLLNGYAHHDTPDSFRRLLTGILRTQAPRREIQVTSDELTLTAQDGRTLSTGIVTRATFS